MAGLAWRDAALMRGLARYLQQATIRYTQDYMAQALARHPELAAALITLFFARFDPDTVETGRSEMETTDAQRDRRKNERGRKSR